MGKRRQARELAIKVLFHLEFTPGDPVEVFRLICDNFGTSDAIVPFSMQLVTGVWEHRQTLDQLIAKSSKHWRLERMCHVDKIILRQGLFEIMYLEDIPPKVSIDEAVELGKKYGTEDSGSFINGVLDNLYNDDIKQKDREREIVV
jgi:transcription antitermination factor NusB